MLEALNLHFHRDDTLLLFHVCDEKTNVDKSCDYVMHLCDRF